MFEILNAASSPTRGAGLLAALARGARRMHVPARVADRYSGDASVTLMLYGLGGKDRLPSARKHLDAGGTLVSWDAGYWHRTFDNRARKYRVSINGFHPPQFVMMGPRPSAQRFVADGIPIEQRGNPAGPILLIGHGPKSVAIGAAGWTAAKSLELRAAFPGRKIMYRPKPKRPIEHGVSFDKMSEGPIFPALYQASLVVCRHSNVAVDACRVGVPVICDDGAAAAIYPRTLAEEADQPSAALREEFLHRLAWWQWTPTEADRGDPWPWLQARLNEIH